METKEQKTEKLINEIEKMTASLFFSIWISDLSEFKEKVSEYLELTKEDKMWDKRVIACVFAIESFFEHDCFDGPPCKHEIGEKAWGNLLDLETDLAESNERVYDIIWDAMDKKQDTMLGIIPDEEE